MKSSQKKWNWTPILFKIVFEAISEASASNLNSWDSSVATTTDFSMSDLIDSNVMYLRNLVLFVQFEKREKHPGGVLLLVKLLGFSLQL